jgi:hypothetical protein
MLPLLMAALLAATDAELSVVETDKVDTTWVRLDPTKGTREVLLRERGYYPAMGPKVVFSTHSSRFVSFWPSVEARALRPDER